MSSSDVHLITLRLCFPQLRSIELYTGSTLKWDLDPDGRVIRILYTEINWDRDTCSTEAVARARKLVPEDWKLLIRPDGVYIHDRASFEQWKRSITDRSTIMPESLTIGSLDPATLSQLLTFAQDQPRGLPIAELTIDDVYAYRTAEDDNTLMPLNDILSAFARRADSVILYKRHLTLESMQELRLEMAAFPTMKFCLDPWSPSFDRFMRDWEASGAAEITRSLTETCPPRTDYRIQIVIGDDTRRADRLDDALKQGPGMRRWLLQLARFLLVQAGPLARHRIELPARLTKGIKFSLERLQIMQEELNNTLRQIIATIIETRRELLPPGFRRLSTNERR